MNMGGPMRPARLALEIYVSRTVDGGWLVRAICHDLPRCPVLDLLHSDERTEAEHAASLWRRVLLNQGEVRT